MADIPSVIVQKDVEMLLIRLQESREQIKAAREAVAPLKANVTLAYQEYEMAVGRLRRETNRLQIEIKILRAQIEDVGQDREDTGFRRTLDDTTTLGNRQKNVTVDPDEIEKDVLLEHLFRILDDEDDDLLSTLTGICNDSTVQLADALERVPWGVAWTTRSPQETLATQYRRLTAWEGALSKQLEELNRTAEDLRKHPHFGIWQQRENGPKSWQDFLQRTAEELKGHNENLTIELKSLREQWAGMVDNV